MNAATGRVEEYRTFVNPGRPIPVEATWIHGIKDEDVAGAPTAINVLRAFNVFRMDCHMILGFNSPFDLRFLVHEYLLAGEEPPPIAFYDVGRLAARLGYGRLSLDELCVTLGVVRPGAEQRIAAAAREKEAAGVWFSLSLSDLTLGRSDSGTPVSAEDLAHRAVPDARATAECFLRLMVAHFGDASTLSEVAAKHDEATPVYSTEKAIKTVRENDPEYRPRICVTGKVEGLLRKEIVQQLADIGYDYLPRVNDTVEFLVVGAKPGPTKLWDADKYGVEIVSADDFVKWLAARQEATKTR
jgi:DNA polymerase III epsilon subunit-like protein